MVRILRNLAFMLSLLFRSAFKSFVSIACNTLMVNFQGNGHWLMCGHWTQLPSPMNGVNWSQKGKGHHHACNPPRSFCSLIHMLIKDAYFKGYYSSILIPLISVYVLTRYATASARSDGLLLLCGGRDANGVVSKSLVQC